MLERAIPILSQRPMVYARITYQQLIAQAEKHVGLSMVEKERLKEENFDEFKRILTKGLKSALIEYCELEYQETMSKWSYFQSHHSKLPRMRIVIAECPTVASSSLLSANLTSEISRLFLEKVCGSE